jgi:hypothetical protein
MAGQVQRRAPKRGDWQPADLGDLVVGNSLLANDDPGARSRVLGDHLDRR